jgi:hypothetical protein
MELPARDVQFDHVAVLNQGQRPADGCFGRRVKNDSSIGCPRHSGIGDSDHVGDSFFQELGRQAHVPDFRKSRITLGPAVLKDQDIFWLNIKIRIQNTRLENI